MQPHDADHPVLPQPVIAKVQGVAAAAGCQLVAQCDLAVAAEGVKFVTSGVTWGFFCSTPGVAVGRNLQRKHAMEMLLTGEPISAAAGAGVGPGQPVLPPSSWTTSASPCKNHRGQTAATVAAGKRAFYQQMDLGLEQAYALAGRGGRGGFPRRRPGQGHVRPAPGNGRGPVGGDVLSR